MGPGRNWAHVNSVDYDPTDDSIIISSRHQSAIIKIGRDKKVKWILSAPEGWKGDFAKKVLQPVDQNGKAIKCEDSKCEGGLDWTWTQHTAWRVDSKSSGDVIYVSAFDNGDARGMEQPALADEKFTRGVMYKIDQKTGLLTKLFCLPISGEYPKDAMLFPDNRHLVSLNHESNTMTFFTVHPDTGLIVMNGPEIKVDQPNCVIFHRLEEE